MGVITKLNEGNKVLATKEEFAVVKEDLAKLEGKLMTAIGASKAEMIKWTFTFITGAVVINILAIATAFIALANLLKK